MIYQYASFIAQPLYSFLPENMQKFLASPLVDMGTLLALILAVLLLFVLNQNKKHLISSTSKMLEETEGHYQLLFRHSPIPLIIGDYSEVKTYLDQLPAEDRADLERYFTEDPIRLDHYVAKKVKILDANQAALKTYKVDKPEKLSRLLTTMSSEETIDPFLQELPQLLQYKTSEIQVHNRDFNGDQLTLLRRTVVAVEAEESWERVFVTLVDITEPLRLRKQNQEFEKRLQESKKLEAMGRISGGIAHDFNNILSPILSHGEMLLMKDSDCASVRKHAQAIVDASVHAQKLIRQILTFSREVGQRFFPLSLDTVLREVIYLIEPILPENITLNYHRPSESLTSFILADATQLHQVLMNLLTNAIHAMEAEGGTLTLWLDDLLCPEQMSKEEHELLKHSGCFQRLRIEDTGKGMDETTMAKIFAYTFTTKPLGKGNGLGLPIVLDILHGCGAEIQVRSTPGKGSVFTLYFPVIEQDSTAGQGLVEDQSGHSSLPHGSEHILLVDDERSIAEVTAAMLMRLGYKVTLFTQPQEALRLFEKEKDRFDLLFVDMDMPQMNGLQLCQKVRELQVKTKVMICTGFADQEIEKEFKDMGINHFIQKPVMIADLSRRIRTVLDEGAN